MNAPNTQAFGNGRGAVTALCAVCLVVWLIQCQVQGLPLPSGAGGLSFDGVLRGVFGLDAAALADGAWWQPITYAFLHGSWIHLVANLFGLWLTGGTLTACVGTRRFLWLFALGAVGGAVGFLLSAAFDSRIPIGTVCVGASAVVAACIGAVTTLAPRGRVTLWLAVLPVPLRAGWLLPLFLVLFLYEAWAWPAHTAYGAHFGGWAVGLLCGLAWRKGMR